MSAPIPMGRRQQGELLIGASQLLGGSGFNPDPGGGEVTMLVLSVKWRRRQSTIARATLVKFFATPKRFRTHFIHHREPLTQTGAKWRNGVDCASAT